MRKGVIASPKKVKNQALGDDKFSFYHAPRSERYEIGKQLRKNCPRSSHAQWKPATNRPDPVDLIVLSNIKFSIKVETFGRQEMLSYADWCGQAP